LRATVGFLTDIVEDVRRRLDRTPLDDGRLMSLAMHLPPPRPFVGALWAAAPPAVIAEVKRASPSAGPIAEIDAAVQAKTYAAAGAAAISVLTEPHHFEGTLADLHAVHLAVEPPILRKDFLIHPSQVIESRAEGADAVLLIAAALSDAELVAMLAAADDLGLGALIEAHGEEDLERALATGAKAIGVNARDLETLDVDLDRALRLLARVPEDRITVLESGVRTREDVERALDAGAHAILVGETLMRSDDPGATLRELRGTA
jgi:indole-3-glycerol phosphate synthase